LYSFSVFQPVIGLASMTGDKERSEHHSAAVTNRKSISAEEPTPQLAAECVAPEACALLLAQWRDLAARCLEPNAFFEPKFALAAAQHIEKDSRLRFLLVWEEPGSGRRGALMGLLPIWLPSRFLPAALARIWLNKQWTLGVPMIDQTRASDVLSTVLAWFREAEPNIVGLMLPLLPLDGAFVETLKRQAAIDGLPVRILDRHSRAILRHGRDPESFLQRSISPQRRKTLRRLRRRLETQAELAVQVLRDPRDVQVAVENFLMLEAKGWKGKRGTALACVPDLAAFTREMTVGLSQEGKCKVVSLEGDGKPIAMGIVLKCKDCAFFWKTAYDEAFAEFSPGVQLTIELTRILLAEEGTALCDSCACADHPMIDHIWSERMAVGDIIIGLESKRSISFAFALARETSWRYIRSRLKRVVNQVRRS